MTSVRDVWIVELGRVHARAGEGRAPCNAMQLRGTLPRVMEPPFCFVFNKDMTRVRARPAAGRYRGAESSTHSMSSSQPPARNMAATGQRRSTCSPSKRTSSSRTFAPALGATRQVPLTRFYVADDIRRFA